MSLGEFELIRRFFSDARANRDDVVLGVGDDAAIVDVPADQELVVAADALVSGVHFPHDFPAEFIGYRALAVNLSDIAAMGATPAWFTLCLTLPAANEAWLADFSRGLLALAQQYQTALIGGDTTSGPLTIAVQILGLVPKGSALRRSGAQAGDIVCLSGPVGDAAAGLRLLGEGGGNADESDVDRRYLLERFIHPTPRIALGLHLRGVATAAMDVSDGLYADLGKLAEASGLGARIDLETLPLSPALQRRFDAATAQNMALSGGDDYELCFTVPASQMDKLRQSAQACGWVIHSIGRMESSPGVRCYQGGRAVQIDSKGYDHFHR